MKKPLKSVLKLKNKKNKFKNNLYKNSNNSLHIKIIKMNTNNNHGGEWNVDESLIIYNFTYQLALDFPKDLLSYWTILHRKLLLSGFTSYFLDSALVSSLLDSNSNILLLFKSKADCN